MNTLLGYFLMAERIRRKNIRLGTDWFSKIHLFGLRIRYQYSKDRHIMANYWLCVTTKENWGTVIRQKIWGVPEHNRRLLQRVKLDDTFVFYVKPKRLKGIFKVVSDPFFGKEKIFGTRGFAEEETFPYRVLLEPVLVLKKPVDFVQLIPVLTFIRNKKKWTGHIRRALQKISKEDYKIMESSMKKA